jgi:hypothetical protein
LATTRSGIGRQNTPIDLPCRFEERQVELIDAQEIKQLSGI